MDDLNRQIKLQRWYGRLQALGALGHNREWWTGFFPDRYPPLEIPSIRYSDNMVRLKTAIQKWKTDGEDSIINAFLANGHAWFNSKLWELVEKNLTEGKIPSNLKNQIKACISVLAKEAEEILGGTTIISQNIPDLEDYRQYIVAIERRSERILEGSQTYRRLIEKHDIINDNLNKIEHSLRALESDAADARRITADPTIAGTAKTYAKTAEMRQRMLDTIELQENQPLHCLFSHTSGDVHDGGSLNLQTIDMLSGQLNQQIQANARRLQLILPCARINQSFIDKLFSRIQVGAGNKPILVYQDSHSETSPPRGQKMMITKNGIQPLPEPLPEPRADEVIVMLYDFTNKQGGDFGAWSQASSSDDIQQLVFINVVDVPVRTSPSDTLNESDMYQALRRRRGDGQMNPLVFTDTNKVILRTNLKKNQLEFEKLWRERDAIENVSYKIKQIAESVPDSLNHRRELASLQGRVSVLEESILNISSLDTSLNASPIVSRSSSRTRSVDMPISTDITDDRIAFSTPNASPIASREFLNIEEIRDLQRFCWKVLEDIKLKQPSPQGPQLRVERWEEEEFDDIAYTKITQMITHLSEASTYLEQAQELMPAHAAM